MSALNLKLASEVQGLEPSAKIELFELHIGDEIYRFHSGVNEYFKPLVWQGQEYLSLPIQATGFEISTSGSMPRPLLRVSNIEGVISKALLENDIVGSKFVRRRTLARYLDAANFKGGNKNADPDAEFPHDVFYIDQKKLETSSVVEFETRSSLEMNDTMLPRRQVIQNACPWRYRGAECGYTGDPVANIRDEPTTDAAADQCGKKLASCKLRFGNGVLPFGGFPAAGLMRV